VGALINITRPWNQRAKIVADPFAGTGTLLLEAAKYPPLVPTCSDISVIASRVVADNITFFAKGPEWLRRYSAELAVLSDTEKSFEIFGDPPPGDVELSGLRARYMWAYKTVGKVKDREKQEFTSDDARELEKVSYNHRLMLYLLLKADRRNVRAFRSGDVQWPLAIRKEAKGLKERVDALTRIREGEVLVGAPRESEHVRFTRSVYSTGGVSNFLLPTLVERERDSDDAIGCTAIAEWMKDGRDAVMFEGPCDIIITDPPYGFNTDENVNELGSLYRRSLRQLIKGFRGDSDGHLIVCLPEQSFVGRGTPWFTRKSAYIRQVFAMAEIYGREVIRVGEVFRSHSRTAGPPYYWQSERGLRRTILHFVLRPAPGMR
jgi:16S rRNA G966 N2-methylase RsmD